MDIHRDDAVGALLAQQDNNGQLTREHHLSRSPDLTLFRQTHTDFESQRVWRV